MVKSISLVSWAYNEEETIAAFLLRAKMFLESLGPEWEDYEHILIDDGSQDGTFAIASEIQKTYPRLKLFRNEKNEGVGWATRRAIQLATKEVLFWQTVDWAYDISHLKEYLGYLGEYDIVQGYRPYGFAQRSDNFLKGCISLTNYLLVRALFGLPLRDYQNVTLYPTKFAQALPCESHSSFTNPELLLKSYWRGATFKQVCIPFLPREKGDAKGTKLPSLLKSLRQIFYFWAKWMVLGRRPDKARGHVAPIAPVLQV